MIIQAGGVCKAVNILITNDDGIYARGIAALVRRFMEKHNVTVIAPERERSGASHSITMADPLRIRRELIPGAEGVEAYKLSGTPADCVIIGCRALNAAPDLVLAGVNHGYNLGTDVRYSGTVSAAEEGALLGIPSMAVSMRAIDSTDFSVPARLAEEILPDFLKSGSLLYSLNVPDLPYDELKGVKYTGLARRTYSMDFEKRAGSTDDDYYWKPGHLECSCNSTEDNDERWTGEGYATITPLSLSNTDTAALKRLRAKRQSGICAE